MTDKIQFTVQGRFDNKRLGKCVSIDVALQAGGDRLMYAGPLIMTEAAFAMLQHQLVPSALGGMCAVEVVEPGTDW